VNSHNYKIGRRRKEEEEEEEEEEERNIGNGQSKIRQVDWILSLFTFVELMTSLY